MRQFSLLVFIVVFATALPSCRHTVTVAPATADTLFFIMAGQSNMAGRGVVEQADMVVNLRLLEMDDAQQYTLKHEPNTLYQGGLAGLDCGLSFGDEILAKLSANTRLGLVQCSISSTSISEWLGDSLHVVHLYDNMLSRTRAAMKSGQVKGVLWMQGETEAAYAQGYVGYDDNLRLFIQHFRRDVGINSLPFYIGLLPDWCIKPYHDSINAAIRRTAATLPGVYLIPTDDLSRKADSLHMDAAGQRLLGKRLAAAALRDL